MRGESSSDALDKLTDPIASNHGVCRHKKERGFSDHLFGSNIIVVIFGILVAIGGEVSNNLLCNFKSMA